MERFYPKPRHPATKPRRVFSDELSHSTTLSQDSSTSSTALKQDDNSSVTDSTADSTATMPPKPAKGEYIETDTGNKVSRRSQIHGTTNIILGGRTVIQTDAIIRGDLLRTLPSSSSASTTTTAQPTPTLAVAIGKYTLLAPSSILHPPRKLHRGQFTHHKQSIGDNVFVGPGAVVEAASVGSNVWIGPGAVIGRLAIIRDGARVLDGAVVPPGMVVGAGEVVGGRPARRIGEAGWGDGWDGREAWRNVG